MPSRDLAPVIADLVRGELIRSEPVSGPRTNTLHRAWLRDGRVLGIKQYARGRDYATEGAALRAVAGAVPVPAIECTLDCVIAYHWIDGVSLAEAARRDPRIWARLAGPLGALLGALARTPAAWPAAGGYVHGALHADHVILAPSLDRIAGVIDWETATAGSPTVDAAALLAGTDLGPAPLAELVAAHGGLPADWPYCK